MFVNRGGRHYWFADHLMKQGYNPTIFCANTFHNSSETVNTNGKKFKVDSFDDFPFIFINVPRYSGNGISRIRNMVAFYRGLFPASKQFAKTHGKPDVILASSVHPLTLVAGVKIARKLGIPCICEIRDLWPEALFYANSIKESSVIGKILIRGERWIYKKANALIFTKEGDTDYIKERKWDIDQGGEIDLEKTHYLNNGLNIETYNSAITKNQIDDTDLDSDYFRVTYIGALRPINNVGSILDAATLLLNDDKIKFLLYGEGSQSAIIKQRVKDENLSNVIVKGQVNNRYVPYILSKSSANLLNYSTTNYNWSRGNSSNKLFEYMASGKPVISTAKMGYSIINKYKCGIELDNDSPEDLAQAIRFVKNMPKEEYRQLGQNGKDGVKDFDFKELTFKLIKIIKKVTGEGNQI